MTGRDDSFVEATTSRPDPEEAMRSLSLLLAPLMLSLGLLACSDGEAEGLADLEADLIPTGSAAPDVTLIAMDDSEFKLSSLRGKTLLLNFWFHGCASCREEMPQLQGLWSEVSSQRSDVAFLAINRGDDKEEIDDASAGEIVATFGIACNSGDTFTDGKINFAMSAMHVPDAVVSVAVRPADSGSETNMSKASTQCGQRPSRAES